MRLPALALAVRSLRVENRARRAFVLRAGLVLVLIAVLGLAVVMSKLFGAPGLHLFSDIVHIDLLFVTLLGIGAFAGVITEEKEDRTLGLLKLCGFDPISILLGKSVAQLWAAALLLAVQIPFAMLAITLGGVSVVQVAAAYWILGAYTLFVYGVALCCSVLCRRTGAAARSTLILVALLLIVPPVATWVLDAVLGLSTSPGGLRQALQAMSELSAWSGMNRVVETGYDEPFPAGAVYYNLALAAGFVALAWLSFARANREEWSPAQARGPLRWKRADGQTGRRGRTPRPRPRPGARALAWKDFHFLAGGSRAIAWRVIGYSALFLLCEAVALASNLTGVGGVPGVVGETMLPWMCLGLGVETLLVGARVLHEEARWNTLAGLVVTPLPLRKWTRAKVRGSVLVLVPALAFFLLAMVLVLVSYAQFGWSVSAMMLSSMVYFLSLVFWGGHMAALLSLLMRRGAVAATFAMGVVWHIVTLALVMGWAPSSPEGPFLLIAVVLTGLALMLHGVIGRQILRVAGRG